MTAIKPHHFVDIITAFGEGRTEFQPHPYGLAVHNIVIEFGESIRPAQSFAKGAAHVARP
jgi:hypothetical protein